MTALRENSKMYYLPLKIFPVAATILFLFSPFSSLLAGPREEELHSALKSRREKFSETRRAVEDQAFSKYLAEGKSFQEGKKNSPLPSWGVWMVGETCEWWKDIESDFKVCCGSDAYGTVRGRFCAHECWESTKYSPHYYCRTRHSHPDKWEQITETGFFEKHPTSGSNITNKPKKGDTE